LFPEIVLAGGNAPNLSGLLEGIDAACIAFSGVKSQPKDVDRSDPMEQRFPFSRTRGGKQDHIGFREQSLGLPGPWQDLDIVCNIQPLGDFLNLIGDDAGQFSILCKIDRGGTCR
jgi:hypothetical protein